jgi:DNA end-binding protein Ku
LKWSGLPALTGQVEKADIVKGFEFAKDKYIEIDPEEVKALRLPTATIMPIRQSIKADEFESDEGELHRAFGWSHRDETALRRASAGTAAIDDANRWLGEGGSVRIAENAEP